MPYLTPTRICDLIMKGGITSGIVYPPAIDKVAHRFWLAGIGGTSAGAIAAALAAAAELRRRNGSPEGFQQLANLPSEISAKGRLLQLFKPDYTTRKAFGFVERALEPGPHRFNKTRLFTRAAWLYITNSPFRKIAENGLGICTGMALDNRGPASHLPPLTQWLSARIDAIAGLPPDSRPLTFGQLWDAPAPAAPGAAQAMAGAPGIRLQLVSTCLTFGRPYALPHLDRRFAFSPAQFRRLFPEYVVQYLEEQGRELKATMTGNFTGDLLPLPIGERFPVIVAVRMSLSFPYLFTTVPLHYLDFNADPPQHEEVHFADGGITSNLPVYFFDSPLPRWPTLAINLQYTQKRGIFGRRNVDPRSRTWMTTRNNDGTLELFNRFREGKEPTGQMLGLAGAIFRAAQTWSDNSFLKLPGYRDRIVEIWLDEHEGGMNLNMPPEVINSLVEYGAAAGERLVERFADAPPTESMSWECHRWTRFRSWMAALVYSLRRWERGMSHPAPGDRPMLELLESLDAVPCYRFRAGGGIGADERRQRAISATEALIEYIRQIDNFPGTDPRPLAWPFDGGPQSWLTLQARASLTPLDDLHTLEPPPEE